MINELIEFLKRYIDISENLKKSLAEASLVRSLKKGTLLLRQGDFSNEGFFVLKGCVRSYTLTDGDDKTIDFFIEEQAILPLNYGQKIPSTHSLECIEDCIIIVNTDEQEKQMLLKFPELKNVCLELSEVMAAKMQEDLAFYKVSTPETRYKKLIQKRPDLLQRIPQYQIASYLGVKPESLSRIRKRLLNK